MRVENTILLCELGGKEVKVGDNANPLIVKNHWTREDLVVLKRGELEFSVKASELKAAIGNATNWRFHR